MEGGRTLSHKKRWSYCNHSVFCLHLTNHLKGVKWVDTFSCERHKGYSCCTPIKWYTCRFILALTRVILQPRIRQMVSEQIQSTFSLLSIGYSASKNEMKTSKANHAQPNTSAAQEVLKKQVTEIVTAQLRCMLVAK